MGSYSMGIHLRLAFKRRELVSKCFQEEVVKKILQSGSQSVNAFRSKAETLQTICRPQCFDLCYVAGIPLGMPLVTVACYVFLMVRPLSRR